MANTFTSLIDLIYPKRSIFLQADATSPATILGGTWGQIKNGLLMCAGHTTAATVGTSGGSDTITIKQMPSHSHTLEVRVSPTAFGRYAIPCCTDSGSKYTIPNNDPGSSYVGFTGGGSHSFLHIMQSMFGNALPNLSLGGVA